MPYLISALMLLLAIPAGEAKSSKSQCQSRCDTNYKFCLNRALTNRGKSQCKAEHKICRRTCK